MPTSIDSAVATGRRAPAAHRPAAEPSPAPWPARGPAERRDVFVDAVRVLGTLAVIGVHWIMPAAAWDGAELVVGNALARPGAWVITWFQPLALLFFAAGAAMTHRHGAELPDLRTRLTVRLRRVGPPVATFLCVAATGLGVLLAAGVPQAALWRVARILPQPLWFLGVDLLLVVVAPLLVRAWLVAGRCALVAAGCAPLLVDLARFGLGVESAGIANLVLVWGFAYLLGVAYAGGGWRPTRRTLKVGAVGGWAAVGLLVAAGPYPPSMIGMPGDAISNLSPPTAPVAALVLAQVCTALLARRALVGWARRSRLAAWVGARSMTLYLWHLPAMFVVVGVVLLGAGAHLPEPWGAGWLLTRPLWFAAAAVVLWSLARCFVAAERGGRCPGPVARGGSEGLVGDLERQPTQQLPVPPGCGLGAGGGGELPVPPLAQHRGEEALRVGALRRGR